MALKTRKPTTPGQRGLVLQSTDDITVRKPKKSLLRPLKKTGGRNSQGRVTTRHRGGGHKRRFRLIDFKRDKFGVPGNVETIEYDPNRSSRIALIKYVDGDWRYILAPNGIQIGDPVSVKKAIRTLQAFDGIVEEATEGELANAVGRANLTGLFCCPHTGVALAVLEKLVKRKEISKNNRVIVISTANGLKFTDFLHKYHTDNLEGIDSQFTYAPIELPADYEKVRETILKNAD